MRRQRKSETKSNITGRIWSRVKAWRFHAVLSQTRRSLVGPLDPRLVDAVLTSPIFDVSMSQAKQP
jgi:hypothetical protein